MSFRWDNLGTQKGCACVVREIDADETMSKTGKAINISSGDPIVAIPADLQEIWIRFDLYTKLDHKFHIMNYGKGIDNDEWGSPNGTWQHNTQFPSGLHSYLYHASVKSGKFSIRVWRDGVVICDGVDDYRYTTIDQPQFYCTDNDAYVSNIIFSDSMLLLTDNAKAGGSGSGSYLSEDEIEAYCGLASGVTMTQVEAATVLIDAYKGVSFTPQERTEKVSLRTNRHTKEMRGKLRHFPRVEVESVTARTRSPFGDNTTDLGVDSIEFDGDDSIYFSFYMPRSLMYRSLPTTLTVKYKSGYKEIPEAVKRACGLIACNIRQMGGVLKWKSRDDYDVKVTLADEGVMSSEVKSILDGVKVQ